MSPANWLHTVGGRNPFRTALKPRLKSLSVGICRKIKSFRWVSFSVKRWCERISPIHSLSFGFSMVYFSSPELAPLVVVFAFLGSLCFPLARPKRINFAGVLIPAKFETWPKKAVILLSLAASFGHVVSFLFGLGCCSLDGRNASASHEPNPPG